MTRRGCGYQLLRGVLIGLTVLLGSTVTVPPAGAARSPSAADWRAEIEEIAQEEWVSADLIHAVMHVESRGQSQAVSAAGAIGLMQLLPATARDMGVDPWVPRDNIRGGARYLRWLTRQVGPDLALVLGAYNAGPHVPVHEWTAETRIFVRQVLGLYRTLTAERRRCYNRVCPCRA